MTRRPATIACTVLVGLAAAGCTGVPTSSSPQAVEHLGASQSRQPPPPPPRDADPRLLVSAFLEANALDVTDRSATRAYLTAAAQTRWQASTVTVVDDNPQVGQFDPKRSTVVVKGRLIGTISATGIYTPDLSGNGSGGEVVPNQFTLKKVDGQWRIDQLRNGLILTETQFERTFGQRSVYFYDAEERYVIPDVRYTPNGEAAADASLLLDYLLAGPRSELQNAETNAELPAQVDPRTASVTLGSPTVIDIPGSSDLDARHRNRLAAQLALTFDQVVEGGAFVLHDGGKTVRIPAVPGTSFTAAEVAAATGAQPPAVEPAVYYVADGAGYDQRGRRLPGPIGAGSYTLTSIAVARRGSSTDIAGISNATGIPQLYLGTLAGGLKGVKLEGPMLTRPSWAAGREEVWVGSGNKLYRAVAGGQLGGVPVPGLPTGAVIKALRVSPDGGRIALVVAAKGTTQVYIGTIARVGGQVYLDGVEPISPVGIAVDDVAWNDELKLFCIGTTTDTNEPQLIELQVDGSLWTAGRIFGLPSTPDSVTVAEFEPVWVSAGAAVWTQSGNSWTSPTGSTAGGETSGLAPAYAE
ncbi:MAG: LpqB family beta-propeller domain-containing protein [Jatrophihabitans sp.]|uniref:LpqB family beta-propeller domain-containing protein n=1 Tax=Jatrophihabitans sp. TaxID=1932789 RepID=UPI003F8093F0